MTPSSWQPQTVLSHWRFPSVRLDAVNAHWLLAATADGRDRVFCLVCPPIARTPTADDGHTRNGRFLSRIGRLPLKTWCENDVTGPEHHSPFRQISWADRLIIRLVQPPRDTPIDLDHLATRLGRPCLSWREIANKWAPGS